MRCFKEYVIQIMLLHVLWNLLNSLDIGNNIDHMISFIKATEVDDYTTFFPAYQTYVLV